MRVTAHRDGQWYDVRFPYDENIVRIMKLLPTSHRSWNPDAHCWRVKIGSWHRLVKALQAEGHSVVLREGVRSES